MDWTARTARSLLDRLRPTLPSGSVIATVAADRDGSCLELSENYPPRGRFEITKTMTGAVLASLVDDGIVDLGDEIGRWLDGGPNDDITLRQRATHTAGLPGCCRST